MKILTGGCAESAHQTINLVWVLAQKRTPAPPLAPGVKARESAKEYWRTDLVIFQSRWRRRKRRADASQLHRAFLNKGTPMVHPNLSDGLVCAIAQSPDGRRLISLTIARRLSSGFLMSPAAPHFTGQEAGRINQRCGVTYV